MEDGCQVLLVEHDQVVQGLAAQCSDGALHDRVRPRRPHGRGDSVDADPSGALTDVAPVDSVAIPLTPGLERATPRLRTRRLKSADVLPSDNWLPNESRPFAAVVGKAKIIAGNHYGFGTWAMRRPSTAPILSTSTGGSTCPCPDRR